MARTGNACVLKAKEPSNRTKLRAGLKGERIRCRIDLSIPRYARIRNQLNVNGLLFVIRSALVFRSTVHAYCFMNLDWKRQRRAQGPALSREKLNLAGWVSSHTTPCGAAVPARPPTR